MIEAYLHGIFPRSEALVTATRDADRGRTSAEAVTARFDQDLQELVELQKDAGMAFFSDGLLRWQDLFRPLVDACRGLESGPLVRWFDTNTFFRAPEVHGPVTLEVDGGLPPQLHAGPAVPTPRAATLPSPYLLSRAAVYRGDRNDLMRELAGAVIRPLAERLVARGYGLVHLEEPWIAFHGIEAGDWKPFQESVALITDGLGATTVLHTTFGDGAPLAERLRQLPVDAIGFDCTETDVSELGTNWEQGVLLGCIDGRRSLVDPVEAVVALVERVAERLKPPRIFLSSAGDLELVPADLARQKVLVLGEATRVMKEHAG